jgi:anti-anti-sigma regulatory factor
MTIIEEFRIVVASDADGGLRISPSGPLGDEAVPRLNDTITAGLRAGAPRVEVDLRAVADVGPEARRVLGAAQRIARHLDVELRVTGCSDDLDGGLDHDLGAE